MVMVVVVVVVMVVVVVVEEEVGFGSVRRRRRRRLLGQGLAAFDDHRLKLGFHSSFCRRLTVGTARKNLRLPTVRHPGSNGNLWRCVLPAEPWV
jgi:hypothetical protein